MGSQDGSASGALSCVVALDRASENLIIGALIDDPGTVRFRDLPARDLLLVSLDNSIGMGIMVAGEHYKGTTTGARSRT